jgi:hypothetical protein
MRDAVPEFASRVDDHIAVYGEVLPHVLVADLGQFVVTAHERGDRDLEQRALTLLDRALRDGDPDVQYAVAASFVEGVGSEHPRWAATWPRDLGWQFRKSRDRSGRRIVAWVVSVPLGLVVLSALNYFVLPTLDSSDVRSTLWWAWVGGVFIIVAALVTVTAYTLIVDGRSGLRLWRRRAA